MYDKHVWFILFVKYTMLLPFLTDDDEESSRADTEMKTEPQGTHVETFYIL